MAAKINTFAFSYSFLFKSFTLQDQRKRTSSEREDQLIIKIWIELREEL
jgi:hypothetical protein